MEKKLFLGLTLLLVGTHMLASEVGKQDTRYRTVESHFDVVNPTTGQPYCGDPLLDAMMSHFASQDGKTDSIGLLLSRVEETLHKKSIQKEFLSSLDEERERKMPLEQGGNRR